MKYLFLIILFFVSVISKAQTAEFTDSLFTTGIEGPAYSDSTLYVVNYLKEGTIGKVSSTGECSVVCALPNGSVGNSIQVTPQGNLLIADYVNHNVLQYDFLNETITVYAHSDSMNQPNDIVLSKEGFVYASDPNWSAGTGNLWMIQSNRSVVLLEANMGTTNGITLSPDEKVLYVNESVQRRVWRYDVLADGSVANKQLLIQFPDFGMDGMKCDELGNIYIARYGKGVIAVVSPEGKLVKEIPLVGKKPTNLVFGGEGNKQVFVTMQERKLVETFINNVSGK